MTIFLRLFVLLILLIAVICESVIAGSITLKTKMTLSVLEDRIDVRLDATNTGDEPATSVKANLYIFDRTLTSDAVKRINVQETGSFRFDVPIPPAKFGRFSFVGEIFFHDAKLDSFSALSGGTFMLDSKYQPAASGRAADLTVIQKETLHIFLKNQSADPQVFKGTLFLPHALTTTQKVKYVNIASKSESTVSFDIINRYGSGGAKYPIFCVVEYRQKDQQDTLLIQSSVRIEAPESWFVRTRWYWLWGLLGIAVLWIMYFFAGTIKKF